MRLIRLALKNFRQHADTELEFRPGLTGIIGPNGAGKTTILEAIAWAIYGAPAVRGTKDTLRFNRAPGRSSVRAELEFELRGERYRVARTPRSAELYRVEQDDPIAAGLGEVTQQLTRRLGMTRREFFNTYFTGQKELQFLAAMGSAERARFLSQVLGYERLRAAQDSVRGQRNVLRGQVEALRRTLGDPEEIKSAKQAAEARLKEVSSAVGAAERRGAEAEERLAELEPAWIELGKARELHRDFAAQLQVAQTRLQGVSKQQKEAKVTLDELAAAAGQLEQLGEKVKPLEGLRAEGEKLQGLAEEEARRKSLQEQLDEQRKRVEVLNGRVAEQEAKGRASGELGEVLAHQEAECERLEIQLQEAMSRWQRDAQDVEARLRMLRDQAEGLKRQIDQLEERGPDGDCPTCQRPLGSEYDRVLTEARAQFEKVVQDGKWHRSRKEQLESEPDEVVAARKESVAAREERERLAKELADVESALAQAAMLKSELETEETRARELAGEVAKLPEAYDAKRHSEVRQELERLRELEKQVTQLETRLEREPATRSALAEAEEEERQVGAHIAGLEARLSELDFSEESYRSAGEEHESARVARDAARLELERVKGERDTAQEAADAARSALREHQKVARNIKERETEHRLHNELDGALGALRNELNDRVRPELSEVASLFLAELTDGRYNQIEINREYEVVVLDDGEEKPVISGGEEDLANLVLRLAISQMIADRANQTLSLLIFDEVFGGLDEQRRESVVRLLQRLQDRFEQVILITHIESVREGLDQVTRVTYDERTGTSQVQDESPGAEELESDDLATLVS
jgi:exonuclease SbcC